MAFRFRTIDGSDNNQALPGLNQADTNFSRIGPANFADGISEMTPGPNPREISNIVVAGGPDTHLQVNGVALSGMMYAWGQFIDHDMDLVFRFAERITVMVGGAVFANGTPKEIGASPQVRAVYLGQASHG